MWGGSRPTSPLYVFYVSKFIKVGYFVSVLAETKMKPIITLFRDLFHKKADEYKRNIGVLEHYIDISSNFLAKKRNIPVEQAREFIVQNLKAGGAFEFKDAKVTYLERQENGDREQKVTSLSRYIGDAVRRGRIIAPTFTVYLNPVKEKLSLLANYIDKNIKLRGLAKKAQFAAKAALNKILESIKKIEQTGRKLANNAISGANVTPSTPLYNKTGHSTLTSTCRSTSGYGNANNEKFLAGNRHYHNYTSVIDNIATIINNVNLEEIDNVIAEFNLVYPTHEQTMQTIKYSTDLYWRDSVYMGKIDETVSLLTPSERAAFCYVGDMWHLMKFNQDFFRVFITELSKKVVARHDDPMAVINAAPELYVNYAHQLCTEETKGIGKDYNKIRSPQDLQTLACTLENIYTVLCKYERLIKAFWMTDNLPSGVAHFPSAVRRTVLASDTDSTIFSVQDWVIWYSGKAGFDPQSMGVYYATVFLASATIKHLLAMMSANFGIEQSKLFRISMKSEYSFDVFVPTQLGKHYYAIKTVQEGNVFTDPEYEIKGVQLKNANTPKYLIKEAEAMMKQIIASVMKEEEIPLIEYIQKVANIENRVISSIHNNDISYFRNSSIKDSGSYVGEKEESPYQHHYFWNEVFGPKYGVVADPPYSTKKISIRCDNPTDLKSWVSSIEDKELAARLQGYLDKNSKRTLSTLYIPTEVLSNKGIPVEVKKVIDYDKLIVDLFGVFYIILETLGFYSMGEKKVTRMVSKTHAYLLDETNTSTFLIKSEQDESQPN